MSKGKSQTKNTKSNEKNVEDNLTNKKLEENKIDNYVENLDNNENMTIAIALQSSLKRFMNFIKEKPDFLILLLTVIGGILIFVYHFILKVNFINWGLNFDIISTSFYGIIFNSVSLIFVFILAVICSNCIYELRLHHSYKKELKIQEKNELQVSNDNNVNEELSVESTDELDKDRWWCNLLFVLSSSFFIMIFFPGFKFLDSSSLFFEDNLKNFLSNLGIYILILFSIVAFSYGITSIWNDIYSYEEELKSKIINTLSGIKMTILMFLIFLIISCMLIFCSFYFKRSFYLIDNNAVILYASEDYYLTLDCRIENDGDGKEKLIIYRNTQNKVPSDNVRTKYITFENVKFSDELSKNINDTTEDNAS